MTTAVSLYAGLGMTTCGPPYSNQSISFKFIVGEGIQTLTSHGLPSIGSLKGLLFVPELDPNDPCNDIDELLIPKNVTRSANLPEKDQNIIALAPWPSQSCAKSYLDAAVKTSPKALIFYKPDSAENQPTSSGSSTSWDIQGGLGWEDGVDFPAFAIPAPVGLELINELALYPGSFELPHSNGQLNSASGLESCTHLYAMINLAPEPTILSDSWMVVLALTVSMIVVFFLTYFVLKLLQRLRRTWHRGDSSSISDLEALMPRRLIVPPQFLSKMPLYRYPGTSEDGSVRSDSEEPSVKKAGAGKECSADTVPASRINPKTPDETEPDEMHAVYEELMPEIRESWAQNGRSGPSFSQASCSICLEDFVPRSSLVRELPCSHIFHAECIDTFLSRESCLCPLCKMSVLPASFLPDQITNFLQRHENHAQKSAQVQGLHPFLGSGESSSTISSLASDSTAQWLNSTSTRESPSGVVHEIGNEQNETRAEEPSYHLHEHITEETEIDIVDAHRMEMIRQRARQLLGPPVANA